MNPEKIKSKEQITTSQIKAEDIDAVADYYQFEVDNGFSSIPEQTDFEGMVKYRQKQIQENKLQVVRAQEKEKTIGTSVVILESGTMGKEIKENEAWAAGTVIDKSRRGQGIGEKLSDEQDRIAREAGKEAILTTITKDNLASMRLRLKVGYELDGINKREDETNYLYKKDLVNNKDGKDWPHEVESGKLKLLELDEEEIDEQVLVDPDNEKLVEQLLNKGYKGVYLLRPKDFENKESVDRNMLVFVKTIDQAEKQSQEDKKFNETKGISDKNDQNDIKKIRKELKDIE